MLIFLTMVAILFMFANGVSERRDLSRSAISEKQVAGTIDSALRRNVINHAPTGFILLDSSL